MKEDSSQSTASLAGAIEEATDRANIEPQLGYALPTHFTLHVIPQAHIDLLWYWQPAETVRMILHTFRSHVELLEAHGTYTYCQSQAAAYEVVRQESPELFARIQNLVDKGQWVLVGGEWTEADPVLPGPEARVRQFLYGQRFFQEHFKQMCDVGWSPGGFTLHPSSFPQIMNQVGIRYFVHKRPREKLGHLPILPYRWRGPDGSEVLAFRSNNKGNAQPSLSEGTRAPISKGDMTVVAEEFQRIGLKDLWGPMGVGDIGGTNQYVIPEMASTVTPEYSTPARFFQAISDENAAGEFEIVSGSMPQSFAGALTTWASVKALNRQAENALLQAECLLAMAYFMDLPHDIHQVSDAWKRVLVGQFHDSVCGCGTDEVKDFVVHEYEEAILHAERVSARVMRQVAESTTVDTEAGIPITVFNPLGHTRTAMLEARVTLPPDHLDLVPADDVQAHSHTIDCRRFQPPTGVALTASNGHGTQVPVMISKYAQLQRKSIAHVRFLAADMPPFGYKTFYLQKSERPHTRVHQDKLAFRTPSIKCEFDQALGAITRLQCIDGIALDASDTPLGQLRIHHGGKYDMDYGVEMRAWYHGLTGEDTILSAVGHRVERYSGDRVGVCFDYEFGSSRFQQEFLIEPDNPAIEVTLSGDWQEVEKYLKIHFGFSANDAQTAFADLPYGYTESLPEGTEYPMQYVCGIRDARRGLLIANNSRYACMWKDGSLSLSALRCATYPAPISDRGTFSLTYQINLLDVTSDQWSREALRAGFDFNMHLAAYTQEHSSNQRPQTWSPLRDGVNESIATHLKPDEDGRGVIMRLFNPTHTETKQPLSLNTPTTSFVVTDLLEQDSAGASEGNRFEVGLAAHKIKTIRFTRD